MGKDSLIQKQWIPFRTNIKRSGCKDYESYLRSPHWKRVRSEYTISLLPQTCLICKDLNYQLHHKSYRRLGFELLLDLLPLCKTCHGRFHELDVSIHYPQVAIRKILNVSPVQALARLRRFNLSKNKNFRTLPADRPDLIQMEKLLGLQACKMQHDRLFPSEPYPDYRFMDGFDVLRYCATLRSYD